MPDCLTSHCHLTTAITYPRRVLQVQLRSRRMHDMAETGPASHNRYKALMLPGAETIEM